jgi:small subunit ribosomal protein S27Ae
LQETSPHLKPRKPEGGENITVSKFYEIKGEKLIRKRKFCPRCGEGVFLAEHEDRLSCGKCGYTEFKSK